MATSFPTLPGVKIKEVALSAPPISGVGTSTAGFVGVAPLKGQFTMVARLVTSFDQFVQDYINDPGGDPTKNATKSTDLSFAVFGFFQNGGNECYVVNTDSTAATDFVKGIQLLGKNSNVEIIAAPGSTDATVYKALEDQAFAQADRFAILDSPAKVDDLTKLTAGGGSRPPDSIWAAFYYPRIQVVPMLKDDPQDSVKNPIFVAPTGHVAGVYARVDGNKGVHKAPANEILLGALGVEHVLTDGDQNALNADGVDAVRLFSAGPTVFGARTVLVSTAADKTFLYVNVRRLTTYIEQSLKVGLRWAVFEPNNLPLRQKITRSVRDFLDGVWRDGALFGATADEAYYVRFPDIFNTDADRANGKLTIEIGLRVTYPAEFIIVRIGLLLQSASTA
ncbi:MAG TPA: phage tail sheath C-terminal domain-containing protein [Candidatus Angelobacter sp.]|jgi:phage tail sheath protein FI|nr:phage tail sheath C-terminal domain-containing protein [Candidatus Angelobacter sp.]